LARSAHQHCAPHVMADAGATPVIAIIKVLRGRGLKNLDNASGLSLDKSDPYVKVRVGSGSARTRTISNDLNPEWNESILLKMYDLNAPMSLEVWDSDMVSKDDPMGSSTLSLEGLAGDTWKSMTLPLGEGMGSVDVEVSWIPWDPLAVLRAWIAARESADVEAAASFVTNDFVSDEPTGVTSGLAKHRDGPFATAAFISGPEHTVMELQISEDLSSAVREFQGVDNSLEFITRQEWTLTNEAGVPKIKKMVSTTKWIK